MTDAAPDPVVDSVSDAPADPAPMPVVALRDLPYLTADLPGIGGRWKDLAERTVMTAGEMAARATA